MGDKETDPLWKNRVTLEKELKEMEASNLSNTEFKVMVIRMLNSSKKDMGTMRSNQSEMSNISEIKNILEGINSRLD